MVDRIVQRKKNWIGHVLRGDGLLREVIEGKMEGKRVKETKGTAADGYVGGAEGGLLLCRHET